MDSFLVDFSSYISVNPIDINVVVAILLVILLLLCLVLQVHRR